MVEDPQYLAGFFFVGRFSEEVGEECYQAQWAQERWTRNNGTPFFLSAGSVNSEYGRARAMCDVIRRGK